MTSTLSIFPKIDLGFNFVRTSSSVSPPQPKPVCHRAILLDPSLQYLLPNFFLKNVNSYSAILRIFLLKVSTPCQPICISSKACHEQWQLPSDHEIALIVFSVNFSLNATISCFYFWANSRSKVYKSCYPSHYPSHCPLHYLWYPHRSFS